MHEYFGFILIISLTTVLEGCTPFGRESLLVSPSTLGTSSSGVEQLFRPSISNNNLFPSSIRARGEQTHMAIPNGVSNSKFQPSSMSISMGTSSSQPIQNSNELNCENFDETCRWRNVDGLFVDELDWYQGSGELDHNRLAIATSTNVLPEGSYAIAATDSVQFPTIKAVLVSDQISCQIGDGEIRFKYWTSPEVQLKVCVKKMSKVFPDFDFCSSSIEKNDPGPVFVNIPEQGIVPFQIFIIADHFSFNSDNLKGGFAIIDSIEYHARMCNPTDRFDSDQTSSDTVPLIPLAESQDSESHVTSKRSTINFITDSPPHFRLGVEKGDRSGLVLLGSDEINESNSKVDLRAPSSDSSSSEIISTVCEAIVCSFNETQSCSKIVRESDWSLSTGPIGNPLTGIRGDASSLPYNEEGSFAYISGPQYNSRLQTSPFSVDRPVTIVFSYYKADKTSRLQVILKSTNSSTEKVVFIAPKLSRNSRRWFRESIHILAGNYDYLAFDVSNLKSNHYIGIDEMFVVDDRRKSFCFVFH